VARLREHFDQMWTQAMSAFRTAAEAKPAGGQHVKPVEECVVRKSVVVRTPVERAFSVFVEQMETWWPATHHIARRRLRRFLWSRRWRRWYERDVEGSLTDWGRCWRGIRRTG